MRELHAVRLLFAALVLASAAAPAHAQNTLREQLSLAAAQPIPGAYLAPDDVNFLLDHRPEGVRLRFAGSDEVYYLTGEPAPLGGRLYKYDTGDVALQVSGWGGITLYTQEAPNGLPAERMGDLSVFEPEPVPAEKVKIFAATLALHLQDNAHFTLGFAADWNGLAANDPARALACDAMRNAARALETAAKTLPRRDVTGRIHVVRVVGGNAPSAALQGDVLTVTYGPPADPAARPSSRAILHVLETAFRP